MKKRRPVELDFLVDKLSNSIKNIRTGDVFATNVILLLRSDLKTVTKKDGWPFNWKYELKQPVGGHGISCLSASNICNFEL